MVRLGVTSTVGITVTVVIMATAPGDVISAYETESADTSIRVEVIMALTLKDAVSAYGKNSCYQLMKFQVPFY